MVKLLLLEGVCGAGKSTVSKALQIIGGEYEVVLLGQSFTYAPIAPAEDAGLLDNETNARFLRQADSVFENLSRYGSLFLPTASLRTCLEQSFLLQNQFVPKSATLTLWKWRPDYFGPKHFSKSLSLSSCP